MNLFARKAVVADEDMAPEHRLHRSLGWPHLIALGVGAIVGTGIFPAVSTSGNWTDVGHYTQMIWKGTSRLGCAVHKGRHWDFLICRYSPPGNVVGQRIP